MKDNNITKNNNKLAGWIEDFVANFAKTNQAREVEATKETIAEININDLDKVVWNDETFYVYFDENGASIINVFGNMVTTLEGVMTLEEVNQKLNSKQIVSSVEEELIVNAEMENEIEKALSEIEVEAESEEDQTAKEYIDNYNNQPAETNNTVEQVPAQPTFENTTATLNEGLIEMDFNEKTAELINKKLAEIEENLINTFEEKMNTAIEQLYARFNPGNVYDMGEQVQQEEVLKFTEEAYETEQQVEEENSVDRTIVDNRYSTEEVETFENNEMIEENIEVEDLGSEEIEEEFIEEDVVTEELSDDVEVFEESEAEEVTEPLEIDEENEIIELEEIEENEVEDLDSEEMEELDGVEIEGDDAEVFKTAKCPYCLTSLSKIAMKSNSIDIQCDNHDCKVKYKVSLNSGKIYLA